MTTPAPTPAAAPAPVSDGRTLGIVGLILAFVFALAGLIVSIIARGQSKRAGVPNGPATAGIVLSIIFLIVQVIALVAAVFGFIQLAQLCAELGPGVYTDGPSTITCS